MKIMFVLPSALFLLVILFATAQRIPTFAGPFKVVIHRFERCPIGLRGMDLFQLTMRATRFSNKITYYDANATLNVDLTPDLTASVRVASWSNNGGWKENAYNFKYPSACHAFMVILRPFWIMLSNAVVGELHEECPVLKGIYKLQNVNLDTIKLGLFREFLYGKWRADAQLLRGDKFLTCLRAFVDTVPDLNELKTPHHHHQQQQHH